MDGETVLDNFLAFSGALRPSGQAGYGDGVAGRQADLSAAGKRRVQLHPPVRLGPQGGQETIQR